LLRGETLEERLKREGKLPVAEVVRIGRETAEGLAAAHAKGLIHRDVKPGNLWLEAPPHPLPLSPGGRGVRGEGGRVKILDFGLAWMAASEGDRTLPGALLGTPGYMAPEQTENHADHRSDLFSLGCVLYRMATGDNPFAGVTPLQKLRNTLLESPRPPQEINPSLPGPLCQLILRLLAHKPEDRPASAAAVARVLETIEAQSRPGRPPVAVAVAAGPPAAVPVAVAAPPPKLDRRWLYLGGGVVAVLLVLIVVLTWPARKRPDSGKPDDEDKDTTSAAKNIARPNARGRVRPATPPRPEEEVVPDRSFTETWVTRPQSIDGLKSWCIETDVAGKVTPLRFEFTADERLLIRYNTTPAWQQFDPKTCGLVPAPFDGSYLALTADTRMCARVGEAGVQLWEEGSPIQRNTLRSSGPVYDATFAPDTSKIVTFDQAQAGGAPQTIWFWHVREGSKLGRISVAELSLSATARAWSPDSKALAVGSPSGVALFRAPWKEAKMLRRPQGVTALSWSPDGKLLATVGQDRKVHLLDEGGEVAEQTQLPAVASASLVPAWSPDGREVAVATEDRKVVVWDRKAKRLTYQFKGHTRPVHAVAFLGDGKTLVSASQGSVRFWNLVKGGLRGTLLNLGGSAWLAVSPEGYYRGSAGVEGRFVFKVREDKDQLREFSPENFRNLYGWKNRPEDVKLSSD
jgi:eukaryotic-like serine/threonine-protein kinase